MPFRFLLLLLAFPLPGFGQGVIDFRDLSSAGAVATAHPYKPLAAGDLILDHYAPTDSGAVPSEGSPALVFVHGGGWTAGSPANHEAHSRYFAARGMAVFNLRYRLISSRDEPPDLFDQVSDIRSALRWIRGRASAFEIDPARLVLAGESAGGHLAACVAFIDAFDDPQDDLTVSARPDLVILLNPITDLPRLSWFAAHAARPGELPLPLEDTAIEDPHDVSIHPARRLSPLYYAGAGVHPPALFVHGSSDQVVPFAQSGAMHEALLAAGNDSELETLEGSDHAFFIPGYGSEEEIHRTLLRMERFLARFGWVDPFPPLLGLGMDCLRGGELEAGTLVHWQGTGGSIVEEAGANASSAAFLQLAPDGLIGQETAATDLPVPRDAIASGSIYGVLEGFLRRQDDTSQGSLRLSCLGASGEVLGEVAVEAGEAEPGSWSPVSARAVLPPATARLEVTLHASGGAVAFDALSLVLGTSARATEFAAWQAIHFSNEERADPAISGPGARPAGEHLNHFSRYALRLGREGHTNILTLAAGQEPQLRFRFDPAKTDAAYQLEWADRPGPEGWSPWFHAGAEDPARNAFSAVSVPFPAPVAEHPFVRLRIVPQAAEVMP